nr:MAG TPA: hypothetical protein [Crassvirales sp.]
MNIHLKPSLNCSAKVSIIFETTKYFLKYFQAKHCICL